MPVEPAPGLRRLGLAALATATLGLLIALYLTVEHYARSALLACPQTRSINCASVTSSRWSQILGVPVAGFGLLYFAAMTVLVVPPMWRRADLDRVRVIIGMIGALAVVYLVYLELFQVGAICLWCTAVHLCALALFTLVLTRRELVPPPPASR